MSDKRSKLNAQFRIPTIKKFVAKRVRNLDDQPHQDDGHPGSSKKSRVTEHDVNDRSLSHEDEDMDQDECIPLDTAQFKRYSSVASSSSSHPGAMQSASIADGKAALNARLNRMELEKQKSLRRASRTPIKPAHSSSAPAPSSSGGEGQSTYYTCMYRAHQTRKHKTWESDGYVKVLDSGACKLYDLCTRRYLAEETVFKRKHLDIDAEYTIGSKVVMITEKTSYAQLFADQNEASKSENDKSVKARVHVSAHRQHFKAPALSKSAEHKESRLEKKTLEPETSSSRAISSNSFYGSKQPRQVGLPASYQGVAASSSEPVNTDGLIIMTRPTPDHEKRYNKAEAEVVDVHIDPQLALRLRPHQIEGIRFLYDSVMDLRNLPDFESCGAILADEMGLGKTVQTIAVIQMLLRQSCYRKPSPRSIDRALIVCPTALVSNWKNEFIKWTGKSLRVECVSETTNLKSMINGKYDVLIINYDKLRIHIKEIAYKQFGLLVCDEAQKIKSQASKTNQAFDTLSIDRRILLTGTPIQNNLSEFYTMINLIAPNLLSNPATFKKQFEDPITRGRRPHCTKALREKADACSLALRRITEPLMLRREASILNDHLPPKYEQVVFCSPSRLQMEVYNAIADGKGAKAILRQSSETHKLPLEGIMILRKLCNSPALLSKDVQRKGNAGDHAKMMLSDASDSLMKSDAGNVEQSGKLTLLMKMLRRIRKLTDDKVVIVSNFTATLDIVEEYCKARKYACSRLDGNVKQSDRMSIVGTFNRTTSKESFVLLLSSKTGGAGLNLIGANRLILIDNDWNPATDAQAMARIHRDGQKKQCYIYRLLLSGTMDEKIFQRQLSKSALSDALIGKGGSNEKVREDFAEDELRDIFRFHKNSACLTHEMLSCTCGGQGRVPDENAKEAEKGKRDSDEEEGVDDDDANDAEDDDDDELPMFRSASQTMKDGVDNVRVKNRRKLAALLNWTHHDFSVPDITMPVEDEILQGILERQGSDKQGDCLGALDRSGESSMQGHFDMGNTQSGTILYVFARKSVKIDDDTAATSKEIKQEHLSANDEEARSDNEEESPSAEELRGLDEKEDL